MGKVFPVIFMDKFLARRMIMNITYNEKAGCFKLDTEHTSYVIGIVDAEKFVGHAYFGAKLMEEDVPTC